MLFVKRDTEKYPLQSGDLENCFVCGQPVSYWGFEWDKTSQNARLNWIQHHVSCDYCNLLELYSKAGRCGWVEEWKPNWHRDPVIDEAKRIHTHPDEPAHRPAPDSEPIAWMIYADWLEENDCPRNAKALRSKYGDAMYSTLRDAHDGPEREEDVLCKADSPAG